MKVSVSVAVRADSSHPGCCVYFGGEGGGFYPEAITSSVDELLSDDVRSLDPLYVLMSK
jgi:hypothetical protein